MNQLTRTVEYITAWENKQISDFQLFKELKAIIYELSDEVIRLETEKMNMIEMYELEKGNCTMCEELKKKYSIGAKNGI